jgi:hypothetical protein
VVGSVAVFGKRIFYIVVFCIMELGETQVFAMINLAISTETSIHFSSTTNILVTSLQENSTLLSG